MHKNIYSVFLSREEVSINTKSIFGDENRFVDNYTQQHGWILK